MIIGIIAGVGIATLVLGFISILMLRAGLSLRPIAFVAVFFLIVGGPQIALHLGQAFGWIPRHSLTWVGKRDAGGMWGFTENEAVTAVADGKFANPSQLFGSGVDPAMIVNLRGAPSGPFAEAEAAQMAVITPDRSLIAARYADLEKAKVAGMLYIGQVTGLSSMPGNDGMWTVQRPVGDWVKAVVVGRTLLASSAPTEKDALAQLEATGAHTVNTTDPSVSAEAREYWLYQPKALVGMILILLVIATAWFFRGSSWAATTEPKRGVPVQSEQEVRRRIMAVNQLDVPYQISEDDRGRIVITYRFADAKWVDLARAHGIQRTHRILLEFDESSHSVRPTEQASSLDWSAGANGGSVRWKTGMGIVFFQKEYTKVYGLRIEKDGAFSPGLNYSYGFDLQEMKAPFIQAVTAAGWRWRPVIWHAPPSMRWLTG